MKIEGDEDRRRLRWNKEKIKRLYKTTECTDGGLLRLREETGEEGCED